MNILPTLTLFCLFWGLCYANAEEFTLVSMHFLRSEVTAEWRIDEKQLAAIPRLTEGGIPPIDPFRASRIAKAAIQKQWAGEELDIERIEILNMLFLPTFRTKAELGKNRWFYLINAKPRSHVAGKRIENEYQLSAVVLFDGTAVLPTLKRMEMDQAAEPTVRISKPSNEARCGLDGKWENCDMKPKATDAHTDKTEQTQKN